MEARFSRVSLTFKPVKTPNPRRSSALSRFVATLPPSPTPTGLFTAFMVRLLGAASMSEQGIRVQKSVQLDCIECDKNRMFSLTNGDGDALIAEYECVECSHIVVLSLDPDSTGED